MSENIDNAIYNGLTTEGAAATAAAAAIQNNNNPSISDLAVEFPICLPAKREKNWLAVIPPLESRSQGRRVSTTPKTGNNKHMNRLKACNINFQMNKVKTDPSMQYETTEQIHKQIAIEPHGTYR